MSQEHSQLVQRASRGDRAALESLFQRHLPGLLAFVRLRAGARLRERDASLTPGDTLYAQWWMRDPVATSTTGLSNGLRFTVCE